MKNTIHQSIISHCHPNDQQKLTFMDHKSRQEASQKNCIFKAVANFEKISIKFERISSGNHESSHCAVFVGGFYSVWGDDPRTWKKFWIWLQLLSRWRTIREKKYRHASWCNLTRLCRQSLKKATKIPLYFQALKKKVKSEYCRTLMPYPFFYRWACRKGVDWKGKAVYYQIKDGESNKEICDALKAC